MRSHSSQTMLSYTVIQRIGCFRLVEARSEPDLGSHRSGPTVICRYLSFCAEGCIFSDQGQTFPLPHWGQTVSMRLVRLWWFSFARCTVWWKTTFWRLSADSSTSQRQEISNFPAVNRTSPSWKMGEVVKSEEHRKDVVMEYYLESIRIPYSVFRTGLTNT